MAAYKASGATPVSHWVSNELYLSDSHKASMSQLPESALTTITAGVDTLELHELHKFRL
jgi:hypothetical protein